MEMREAMTRLENVPAGMNPHGVGMTLERVLYRIGPEKAALLGSLVEWAHEAGEMEALLVVWPEIVKCMQSGGVGQLGLTLGRVLIGFQLSDEEDAAENELSPA